MQTFMGKTNKSIENNQLYVFRVLSKGVRPYKCESCDKAFTQRCSLESHSRKVHGMQLSFNFKQRRTKMYVCEDCGHSTDDPEDFYSHLKNNHPNSMALQRRHDKRLFKFSATASSTDVSSSSCGSGTSTSGASASSSSQLMKGNSSSSGPETSTAAKSSERSSLSNVVPIRASADSSIHPVQSQQPLSESDSH